MRLNHLTVTACLVGLAACAALPQLLFPQALFAQAKLKKLEGTLEAPLPAAPPAASPATTPPGSPATGVPGYLGANVDDTAEPGKGVLITGVKKGAPSELGGLKDGDIIVEIDGIPCRNLDDLDASLAKATVGTKLTMKVFRKGTIGLETKVITLGRRPAEATIGDSPATPPAATPRSAASDPLPPLTARPAAPTIGSPTGPLAPPAADSATSPPTLRPAADPFSPARPLTPPVEPPKPGDDPLTIPGREPALELPPPPGGERPSSDPLATDPLTLPSSDPLASPPAASGRASLGIKVVPLNDETRRQYEVRSPARQGAVVVSVNSGSAAAGAGLTAGSVVVGIDGQLVRTSDDLVSAISAARPGQEVELRVYQGDQMSTKMVTLAAAGAATARAATSPPPPPRPGMTVEPGRPLMRRFEDMVESLSPSTPPPPSGSSIFDPSRLAELHSDIKAMKDQLDTLEARVKALEAKGGANP